MNKMRMILLKNLLLSTSRLNKIKYTKDSKLKSRTLRGLIGLCVLYFLIMFYSVSASIGLGALGYTSIIPLVCVFTISILSFFFTFLKTNGYMFAFKEYDMLMSLPFDPKTIAQDKFLYMYIASLPWIISVSLAMGISYGIYAKANILSYIFWFVMTFALPIIPMLLASFIGFLIAKISSGFKRKNIIQTVLTFAFIGFCFSLQYIIDAIVKNGKTEEIISNFAKSMEKIGNIYWPVAWFGKAVNDTNVICFLIFLLLTYVLFEFTFIIIGKYYRQINSALKSHAASQKYIMSSQKKRSVVSSVAFKEFRRLLGSQTYLINIGMGVVFTLAIGLLSLFLSFDKFVFIITKGAPIDSAIVQPAIPFIIYFFVGMVASTTCSPSLEGKNFWIIKSLPIEMKDVYKGKMLFNLYLYVPVAVFSTICICFSARVSVLNALIYIVEIIALCLFSTAWGCVCGIKYIKLDWENEIEVVKQGTAVAIYLFPNMILCLALAVAVILAGLYMDSKVISLVITAIALLLAFLAYKKAIKN